MAQQFLDQLPRVQDGELPNSAECMICREKYGTFPSDNGVVEHAVLLPCSHHVGSECIAVWLSPKTRIGNPCPLCRKVLFDAQNGDYDDDDHYDVIDESEDEDESGDENSDNEHKDEDDEDMSDEEEGNGDQDGEGGDGHQARDKTDGSEQTPMTVQSAFQRLATCCYVITPPREPAREEMEGRDGQEWFQRWPIPTPQQCEDSEKRARQTLLRPQPSGLLCGRPDISSPSADLEIKVEELASAYRTMAFRETLLYLNLREAGARIRPLVSPYKGLFAQQEEVLLWELGQRGAFSSMRVRSGHMALTNRQSWYVHRVKGEVYTYEHPPASDRGYWSTNLGFGRGDVE